MCSGQASGISSGREVYPEQVEYNAIEQLANRHSFIDINKVGIHGHSGGGFMSTAAICQYPDFFKVAVSCAGNHDNNIYNRWWSETHHGVKEEITEKGDTTFYWRLVDYFSEHLRGESEKFVDISKR